MKILYISIIASLLFISCKQEKRPETKTAEIEQNILEKIADAHGFKNWNKVNKIAFTFNVDTDSTHFERSWIWDTKNNMVTGINSSDTLTYSRKAVDSTLAELDAGFINDKYWLLAPFNLIWDQSNFTYEHQTEALAPISKKPMQKLTIVYSDEGGYTPGDAYDFYFEEDHIIEEWSFRKANQDDPNLSTTWEAYESMGGLLISREHHKADGSWLLSFSGVQLN